MNKPAHIVVEISGPGAQVQCIRLRDLIEILSDLERALVSTANPGHDPASDVKISLVRMERKLARWHLRGSMRVRNAAEKIATAIEAQTAQILPQPATEHIRDMHRRAVKRGWSITFGNATFSTKIEPDREIFADPVIKGTTTVFGKLMGVGGRRPRAKIELPNAKLFTADVGDVELAKQLGNMLYKFVSLNGDARWYTKSLELSHFRIREIGAFNETRANPRTAFDALRLIAPGTWDDIDPDRYIRDLRDDEHAE